MTRTATVTTNTLERVDTSHIRTSSPGDARRRAEPGWRAAVLDEQADRPYVWERVRKAAAIRPRIARRRAEEKGGDTLFVPD
jgi:hypothetical protein